MSVNLFELSWSWYEDHIYYLYTHPDQTHTKEKFNEDVNFLCKKYALEYIKSEKKTWAGFCGLIQYISDKMVELNYESVNMVSANLWGGYILDSKKDSDYKKCEEFIGEELAKEFIKHNVKVRRNDKLSQKRRDAKKLKDNPQ